MHQPVSRIQTIAIVALALVGLVAYKRLFDRPRHTRIIPQRVDAGYNVTLLTQEAAYPGKVVVARKDGRILASYRCTAQDAAVAWIYCDRGSFYSQSDRLTLEEKDGDLNVDPGIDEKNNPYAVMSFQAGPLLRVRIPRGFAKVPMRVRVPVYGGRGSNPGYPPTSYIDFTRFAAPEKVLSLSDPSEVQKAEKDIRIVSQAFGDLLMPAEVELNPPIDQQLKNREFTAVTLLGTSYCPQGDIEPNFREYWRQTEAVRVRIDHYHFDDKLVNLRYRNAQIATIDGARTLRLPSTQQVGWLLNARAVVSKSKPTTHPNRNAVSSGDLLIELWRRAAPQDLEFHPTASFANISPSIEELGIDTLRVRLGLTGYGVNIRSRHQAKIMSETTIPELAIVIRVSTPVRVSSKTVILPIHIRHSAPPRIRSAVTVAGSGGAGHPAGPGFYPTQIHLTREVDLFDPPKQGNF